MSGKLFIILFMQLLAKIFVIGQHSPYSLRAAVEALHRREAQLALKDNNNFGDVVGGGVGNLGGLLGKYGPSEDNEYWDNDPDEYSYSHLGRLQVNQILARQLAKEHNNDRNYENELNGVNYLPEEKKRSFFRERGEKYPGSPSFPSVFRERELEPFKQPEMTEEFLHEIQKEKELEREETFRETLRRLWENYQQQENEIKQDLFNENNNDKRKHIGDDINDVTRTGSLGGAASPAVSKTNDQNLEVNPYYFGTLPMDRKRSYPVLPWLPATKKKRFPVAKRSPKMTNDNTNVSGTDEKVAKELQVIFGQPKDEKKKRSTNDDEIISTSQKTNGEKFEDEEHMEHGGHYHNRHAKSNINSNNNNNNNNSNNNNNEEDEEHEDESDEHEHDHEHEHEHDDDDEDEHDHDFDDDDEDERKKKREITEKKRNNLEIIKEDQIIPGDLTEVRKKKSIQWSKYFGLDRKKKLSSNIDGNNNLLNLKALQDDAAMNKKDIDPEKIESMNNKLKLIENYIIDETVKYTGAHEGIVDPDEIRHLKDHVVSRLATAYNLEKMRLALEKLRQSVDNENHLQRNEIEVDYKKDNDIEKRVAVKKEKVDYDHTEHSMDFSTMSKSENVPSNNLDVKENDDKNIKKKKNTGGGGGGVGNSVQQYRTSADSSVNDMQQDLNEFEEELGAGHFEPLNDMYLMGNKGFNNNDPANGNEIFGTSLGQCPLLDAMTDRCRGIDILSGDINQDLLQTCSIHQLCYLCGTSQIACDFQYLSEADSICGHNNDCQSAARSALMILRGSPGPQLGPKECLKNPCLFKAMKEIGL